MAALLLRRFQSKRNSRFFVVPASSTAAAAGLSVPLPLISFAVVVGVVRVATSFGRGREFTMTDVAGAAELMPN